MTANNRHADNFARGQPGKGDKAAKPAQAAQKPVDNDAQAARAEAARELTYTTGDDGVEAPPAREAAAAIAPLAKAIASVRTPERPSPFGVAHFPPIPAPREAKSSR